MVSLKIQKGYMLFLQKHFSFICFAFLIKSTCYSQNVVNTFYRDSVDLYLNNVKKSENKVIPNDYKDAIQIALLYYPELKNTKIIFRVKKGLTPLSARPSIGSVFLKASKRRYIITISNSSNEKLSTILLRNLSFNSQIGVLGHELSHISEYNSKSSIFFICLVLKHLNRRSVDKFEYNTDRRCIEHGLGHQLLSWSEEVRKKLNISAWGVTNIQTKNEERYMNPDTIIRVMKLISIY